MRKEKHLEEEDANEDEEIIYKIEIPANRYPYHYIFYFYTADEIQQNLDVH